MNYGRVMLKLSGEALAGSGGKGYDEAVVRNVAQQVKVSVDRNAGHHHELYLCV